MNKNLNIINFAVSMIIKAVVIAARFSGRVRKRSLKRLAGMEVDAKVKEIIFLRDMVEQLQMHVSIFQKRIKKKQKKPRYTLRERLFTLCIACWTNTSIIITTSAERICRLRKTHLSIALFRPMVRL